MILDTNALSASVDGEVGVGDVLRRQARAALPVIVPGGFRYGIAESRHRAAYETWLDSQLPHFDILSVTEDTAIVYADLRVALKRSDRAYRTWPMMLRSQPSRYSTGSPCLAVTDTSALCRTLLERVGSRVRRRPRRAGELVPRALSNQHLAWLGPVIRQVHLCQR